MTDPKEPEKCPHGVLGFCDLCEVMRRFNSKPEKCEHDRGTYWGIVAPSTSHVTKELFPICPYCREPAKERDQGVEKLAKEIEPFLLDRFAQCIREHAGQVRSSNPYTYAIPYAKDCESFLVGLIEAERQKAAEKIAFERQQTEALRPIYWAEQKQWELDVAALQSTLSKCREDFRKFGHHLFRCSKRKSKALEVDDEIEFNKCTCGFSQALEG
jgi:hypothetical protein